MTIEKLKAIAEELCEKAGKLAHTTDDKTKNEYYKAAHKAMKAGFSKQQITEMAKAAASTEYARLIASHICK